MKIDFRKLISSEYLVKIDPATLHPTDKILLIVGGTLVVLGLIFLFFRRFAHHQYSRRLWQRLATWALTIGLLEVLWFGLRYQQVIYLGSHLAAFIILLIGLLWLARILQYRLGRYRHQVTQWEKDQVKQKYLTM